MMVRLLLIALKVKSRAVVDSTSMITVALLDNYKRSQRMYVEKRGSLTRVDMSEISLT